MGDRGDRGDRKGRPYSLRCQLHFPRLLLVIIAFVEAVIFIFQGVFIVPNVLADIAEGDKFIVNFIAPVHAGFHADVTVCDFILLNIDGSFKLLRRLADATEQVFIDRHICQKINLLASHPDHPAGAEEQLGVGHVVELASSEFAEAPRAIVVFEFHTSHQAADGGFELVGGLVLFFGGNHLVAEQFVVIGKVPEAVALRLEFFQALEVVAILGELLDVPVSVTDAFEALLMEVGVGVIVLAMARLLFHGIQFCTKVFLSEKVQIVSRKNFLVL